MIKLSLLIPDDIVSRNAKNGYIYFPCEWDDVLRLVIAMKVDDVLYQQQGDRGWVPRPMKAKPGDRYIDGDAGTEYVMTEHGWKEVKDGNNQGLDSEDLRG
jgi:hypothetical protein